MDDPVQVDVAVVGAGLAGLACARRLNELGVACAVFEAADRVGGRVATDELGGFLLDRGFQVLLDSYPEVRATLDLEALGCRAFAPGALVRAGGRAWRVVDPWRAPLQGLATLRAPFVKVLDGFRMAALRRRALVDKGPPDERSADELLRDAGFSPGLRERFIRPFFAGVTLDRELAVPAWYFLSLFGWFATGRAVLPARGMGAVPEQLAASLPPSALHLRSAAARVSRAAVERVDRPPVSCRAAVVATDADAAGKLLGAEETEDWLGTTTLWYASERSPVGEPLLVLAGDDDGPVHHLCVPSDVQPSYAPAGAALVSVSVLGVPAEGDEALDEAVRDQLAGWYGTAVREWRLLRIDRIPRALPRLGGPARVAKRARDVFLCGDHVATPSIQGTLESGRRTAEAVQARLIGLAGASSAARLGSP